MNDVALQKQINKLAQELKFSGENTEDRLIQLRADIDRCKLKVEALRRFLESAFPSFTSQFNDILEQVRQEVNPESD